MFGSNPEQPKSHPMYSEASVQTFVHVLLSELMDEMGLISGLFSIADNKPVSDTDAARPRPRVPDLVIVYQNNVPVGMIEVKKLATEADMNQLCHYMKCLTHYYGIEVQFGLLVDATSFRIAWTPESDVVAQSEFDLKMSDISLGLENDVDYEKYRLPGRNLTASINGMHFTRVIIFMFEFGIVIDIDEYLFLANWIFQSSDFCVDKKASSLEMMVAEETSDSEFESTMMKLDSLSPEFQTVFDLNQKFEKASNSPDLFITDTPTKYGDGKIHFRASSSSGTN
jgi:hypothetical protein